MNRKKTFIIAEAGVNHNGSFEIAKQLINEAKKAGADAIKFQTFKADKMVSKNADKAEYQKNNSNESQYQMIKRLELNFKSHLDLSEYCKIAKIQFLSSPFDLDSVDMLAKLGLKLYKIPSSEITNYPYLCKIGKFNKLVLLSTGMSDLGEIEDALDVLISNGTQHKNIIILQCNTEYPTPFEDVNLSAMITIKNAFGIRVGYSDHTEGIEASIAAVALGATVIEKHFTLDKTMEGPDNKASLEPQEFSALVKAIRNIEKAIGDGIKKPSNSEKKNIKVARKSLVAIHSIKKGELFTRKNIGIKRPGIGITPMRWNEILGMKANKNFKIDDLIEL